MHPLLNITLQPLPFMEYSLEKFEHAVVFGNEAACSSERYALHKLLVFGERSGSSRAKSSKDLAQAACLAAYLWDHRREALADALKDLLSRGKAGLRATSRVPRHCTRPIRKSKSARAWPPLPERRDTRCSRSYRRPASTNFTSACSAWFTGVGTPSAAPRRATVPLR